MHPYPDPYSGTDDALYVIEETIVSFVSAMG